MSWLATLLLLSGDIHPNPGPVSHSVSTSSNSSSDSIFSALTDIDLSTNLSLVHYNVQSIRHKLDILYSELSAFDILTFSETWLNDSISSDELFLPSFHSPERRDRPSDSHGGVMVYIKNNLAYKRRNDLELNGIECIWVELTLRNRKLLIGTFYKPPSSGTMYSNMIENSVSLAVDTCIKDIIITGDFNVNVLNTSSSKYIVSLCQQFNLSQTIREPTHYTETSHSLIDLLLLSNESSLVKSGVADPFLDQDIRYHCPIFGIFKYTKPKSHTYKRKIWKYQQGDYPLLRQKINEFDWDTIENDDLNTYATNFSETLIELSETCIPNKVVTIRPNEPLWITQAIKQSIRARKRAYRKAKHTNTQTHWNKFRKLRNKTVSLIRKSKQQHYDNLASKLTSESLSTKDWWKVLKLIQNPNNKSCIPPLKKDDLIISDNEMKANLLNTFFAEQTFLDDSNKEPPDLAPHTTDELFSFNHATPNNVQSILQLLPKGKASGPDQLNNIVLCNISEEVSVPLCKLYNFCIDRKMFPRTWKEAYVTAVFKKGDPAQINNYRPISLLNVLGKVFEKILFQQIFNHLQATNFLTPFQSGFVPQDSTVNQLTYLYNTFCQALDSGKEVRAIFFDISKAFDRVWHRGLLSKLRACGFSQNSLSLLTDYLTDRRQCVVLPGAKSSWKPICAGVPQGSILGPLLFLIFINDIVTQVRSNIRLFADDTSLYLIIDKRDQMMATTDSLNEDISNISKWASDWLVTFNPSKSESMIISRKHNTNLYPALIMDNQHIVEVSEHKHLGVILSNDCSWHSHIEYIVSKAWPKINLMRSLAYKLDRRSLETMYISFIRPLLEYADTIWDNCTENDKHELDKIQNEAARICTGTTKLVSLDKLKKEIGWESLSERRRKHKLIAFYKMTHSLSPSYLSDLVPQSVSAQSQYNLRNTNDLQVPHSRTSLYFNSFLPSVIRAWNELSTEARNAESLDSFKRLLNMDKSCTPKYYYTGTRKAQVLHTRLRTNCSALNHDLFSKSIVDSPLCRCGQVESTYHFFFACSIYDPIRPNLVDTVSRYCSLTLHNLLYGDDSLPFGSNKSIFEAVQNFIIDSKRF